MENPRVNTVKDEQCETTFGVEITANEVKIKTEEIFENFRKNASLPGFRRGNAPMEMIKQKYSQRVKEEVIEALIKDSLDYIFKEKVKNPITSHLTELKFDFESPMTFVVKVEKRPEFEPHGYKKIRIQKTVRTIGEKEIEENLKRLAEHNARIIEAGDKAIKKDSLVVLDYECSVDGKKVKNGSMKNQLLDMSKGELLPGFAEQLIDARQGEEKDVKITFPDNYAQKELAGKEAVFRVSVRGIKEKAIPPINEELARELGFPTMKELKERIKGNLEHQESERIRKDMEKQILESITRENPIPVPNSLVENVISNFMEHIKEHSKNESDSNGKTGVDEKSIYEKYRPLAEEQVRGYLVLSAIAGKEKIEVSDDEINKKIEEAITLTKREPGEVKKYFQENIGSISHQIRENKIFDFLIDNAKIKEVKA